MQGPESVAQAVKARLATHCSATWHPKAARDRWSLEQRSGWRNLGDYWQLLADIDLVAVVLGFHTMAARKEYCIDVHTPELAGLGLAEPHFVWRSARVLQLLRDQDRHILG